MADDDFDVDEKINEKMFDSVSTYIFSSVGTLGQGYRWGHGQCRQCYRQDTTVLGKFWYMVYIIHFELEFFW